MRDVVRDQPLSGQLIHHVLVRRAGHLEVGGDQFAQHADRILNGAASNAGIEQECPFGVSNQEARDRHGQTCIGACVGKETLARSVEASAAHCMQGELGGQGKRRPGWAPAQAADYAIRITVARECVVTVPTARGACSRGAAAPARRRSTCPWLSRGETSRPMPPASKILRRATNESPRSREEFHHRTLPTERH